MKENIISVLVVIALIGSCYGLLSSYQHRVCKEKVAYIELVFGNKLDCDVYGSDNLYIAGVYALALTVPSNAKVISLIDERNCLIMMEGKKFMMHRDFGFDGSTSTNFTRMDY